jgi:membrane protein
MLRPGQHISWKDFAKEVKNEYSKDKLSDVAGSVTFFGLLAIFPFLLASVALAGLIIDPEETTKLVDQLAKVAPPDVAKILSERIHQVAQSDSGGTLGFGLLAALWSASGGVVALMSAFNTAYDVEETRPFWKVRLIAIGAVVATVVFMLSAIGITLLTPVLANMFGDGLFSVLQWFRLPIAGVLVMFLWAMLYYFLPNVKQKFHFITFGAVVGVVIWLIASWGFSVYVQNFASYDATYGTLGGIIVFLMWMWITAQVILIGAEMNSILEHTSPEGKAQLAKEKAEKGSKGEGATQGKDLGRKPSRDEGRSRRPGRDVPALASSAALSPDEVRAPARTRNGKRKKTGKLELALMGVVALRSLRKGGKGRGPRGPSTPPSTVH